MKETSAFIRRDATMNITPFSMPAMQRRVPGEVARHVFTRVDARMRVPKKWSSYAALCHHASVVSSAAAKRGVAPRVSPRTGEKRERIMMPVTPPRHSARPRQSAPELAPRCHACERAMPPARHTITLAASRLPRHAGATLTSSQRRRCVTPCRCRCCHAMLSEIFEAI